MRIGHVTFLISVKRNLSWLAQQLSQLQSKRARDELRAPALLLKPGGLHEQLLAVLLAWAEPLRKVIKAVKPQ
jgi:hypothetical protein